MIAKDTFFSKKRTLNFRGTLYELSSPVVMGIVNITPDSFYQGSRFISESDILKRCEAILSEGGIIIDIGAYSSRPSAEDITADEEMNRLLHALQIIRKEFPQAILSVDTFRASIARKVVEEFGVQMINDISAGEMDEEMLPTIAELKVPYVMMHMKGTPQTMQQHTQYDNLVRDIIRYLTVKVDKAMKMGIHDIIIDPGFGFSKNLDQNYQLLSRLQELRIFQLPLLIGLSRKSMISRVLDTTSDNALAGTIAANTLALLNGADILRVHDVKEAVDAIKIVNACSNNIN